MRRRCVTILAWLLIAAVPVQGYAAAMMVNCGTRQHDGAQHHSHGADPSHHHAEQMGHDNSAIDTHDDPEQLAMKLSCSACSACCIGIALPVSATSQALRSPSAPPLIDSVGPPVDITTVGLFRPPRVDLV